MILCPMPVLRSQTVYLSITVTLASCRLLCHSKIRSCSLLCLALSQHHAALALSWALLSQHHAALALPYALIALSQHHAALALSCALLSQHHAALALSCALLCLSITPLMCLALSQHAITPLFSALPCPGYSIMSIAQLHTHVKQSCAMN